MRVSTVVLYTKGDDLVSWRKSLPKDNIEVIACEIRFDNSLDSVKIEEIGQTKEIVSLVITFPTLEDHFDFSFCRNTADKYATGEWIFHMDSDERLAVPHDEFWLYMQALNQSEADSAYVSIAGITRENKHTRTQSYDQRYNNPNMRLHRRTSKLQWQGICHETLKVIEDGIVVADTEILLYHKGYAIEDQEMENKLTRNAKLLVREYMRDKSERNWSYLIKTFSLINKQGK